MTNPIPLIIIGAGGAGSEALWVAQRINAHATCPTWEFIGFVDDNPKLTGAIVNGLSVLGTLAQVLKQQAGRHVRFHCAIGGNRQRQRVAATVEAQGFGFASLIDPTALIAGNAIVGEGTYIGPLAIVAPNAHVGRHVLINTHAGIGHHAVVGDFAQVCPGARVNGGCRVDTLAFIGSNATVHPGLTIGEGASIGANSFVIRSVKPRFSMMGVPARIVSRPAENGPDAQS
jgi:sugar O-acyltransferase (sialic acid O-acetyltransferase NeuD family)